MLSSRLAPSCLRPLPKTLRLNARPKALSVQARYFAMPADYNPAKISDYITKEHRGLEEAYNKILNDSDRDNQERWQNQFTWELARHSIAEELVVYPAFERHLSDGKDMAEHDRAEHQSVKEHLYKFQGLHPTDSDFEPTLKTLWENLSHHIDEEESKDLPKLEKALDPSESERLVNSFTRTQKFIPTHSHPSAPTRPPFETVAGLMAAPIDHLRDLFKKFPEEAKSEMPP